MWVKKGETNLGLIKPLKEPDVLVPCEPLNSLLLLMYLFKMFLHAWENHNDWHQSAKQQQEGESQPAHGGVVCWWAAWWQEAGGRAAQTGRLEKRRVRELAGPSCRNSGTGLWGFGIIRVMYAQLAGNKQKNKTNNTVCSVRTTIFLLQRQMIYSQPVILAAIIAELSFPLIPMQLCEQDHRGCLHDSHTDCWEVSEALRQRLELSSAILH